MNVNCINCEPCVEIVRLSFGELLFCICRCLSELLKRTCAAHDGLYSRRSELCGGGSRKGNRKAEIENKMN